jgi:hypothetical protein
VRLSSVETLPEKLDLYLKIKKNRDEYSEFLKLAQTKAYVFLSDDEKAREYFKKEIYFAKNIFYPNNADEALNIIKHTE